MFRRRKHHDEWVGNWNVAYLNHGAEITLPRHEPGNHRNREILVKRRGRWVWVKGREDYHDFDVFTMRVVDPNCSKSPIYHGDPERAKSYKSVRTM